MRARRAPYEVSLLIQALNLGFLESKRFEPCFISFGCPLEASGDVGWVLSLCYSEGGWACMRE